MLQNQNILEHLNQINLLDAVIMVSDAWHKVWSIVIKNCYQHAGFCACPEPMDNFDEEDELPLAQWIMTMEINANLYTLYDWDDYVQVDDHIITQTVLTDPEIVAAVLDYKDENDDDVDNVSISKLNLNCI